MDAPIHEEGLNGHIIKIYLDEDAENPRHWDNLGTMVCGHSRYILGDDQSFGSARDFLVSLLDLDSETDLSVDELIDRAERTAVMLPLYLYDHSGLVMNTTGFHCPWDSGQVGFIYVTLEDIRTEYGVKRVSAKHRKQVADILRCEVHAYSDYLAGNVHGFVIEKDGEETDSCWGFVGDYDGYVLEEARACVPSGALS